MNKLFLTIGLCFYLSLAVAQKTPTVMPQSGKVLTTPDSTLIKLVKGINETLKARYKINFNTYNDFVLIDEKTVKMDSLYKYDFKDFKKITISFDEQPAIYGKQTIIGIIRLQRK